MIPPLQTCSKNDWHESDYKQAVEALNPAPRSPASGERKDFWDGLLRSRPMVRIENEDPQERFDDRVLAILQAHGLHAA